MPKDLKDLIKAFHKLKTPKQIEKFLLDICTPQELDQLVERLQIVTLLNQGLTQRQVRDKLGVSISTVTRGARQLKYGHGGFKFLLKNKHIR